MGSAGVRWALVLIHVVRLVVVIVARFCVLCVVARCALLFAILLLLLDVALLHIGHQRLPCRLAHLDTHRHLREGQVKPSRELDKLLKRPDSRVCHLIKRGEDGGDVWESHEVGCMSENDRPNPDEKVGPPAGLLTKLVDEDGEELGDDRRRELPHRGGDDLLVAQVEHRVEQPGIATLHGLHNGLQDAVCFGNILAFQAQVGGHAQRVHTLLKRLFELGTGIRLPLLALALFLVELDLHVSRRIRHFHNALTPPHLRCRTTLAPLCLWGRFVCQ
mmetsp:Transcript_25580/g.60411  ORF Transcript_25580/g.60411 Transcript_25580/m.60411 type:complete len:275 (-) Transcript_25580:1063-1887(-)